MKHAAFGLLLGLAAAPPCQAQTVDDIAKNVVQSWYNCVGYSYGRNSVATPDRNTAIEAAFASCGTEEGVMRTWAASQGVPQQQIEMIVITHKMKMKRAYTTMR